MVRKHFLFILYIILNIVAFHPTDIFAKGGSSGGSSKSSSFSGSKSNNASSSTKSNAPSTNMYGNGTTTTKSSFAGITSPTPTSTNTVKPSTPIVQPSAPKTVMYGSGNVNTKSTFSGTTTTTGTATKPTNAPKIVYATNANTPTQVKASLNQYKAEKAKYVFTTTTPPVTTRSTLPPPKRTYTSYQEYKDTQRDYYRGRNWDPPVYIYQTYPSFGGFSNPWLFFMLGNMSSDFFYHRKDDPGVKTFLVEAERLAKDNKDLQSQLDKVKADMEDMKKENKEVKKDYFPPDQDPDVATELEMDDDESNTTWLLVILGVVILGMIGGMYLLWKQHR